MRKKLLFVGIDVDDKAYTVCCVDHKGKKIKQFSCLPEPSRLYRHLLAFTSNWKVLACYEASYIGYSLQRFLSQKGLSCEIIAPSLIPSLPGRKVKTDRCDSEKLARFYSQDLLTTIYLPDSEGEGDRNLIRSRNFVLSQLKATKNHIHSYIKLQGWNFKQETGLKSYWTKSFLEWLDRKITGIPAQSLQLAMRQCLELLRSHQEILSQFDEQIQVISEQSRYHNLIESLKCFRGIDTLTAMVLATELGDIKRFDHPRRLSSYVGLDIKEHSSGGREQKGGISKMGNSHVRKAVIEACQFAIHPPRVSKRLRQQQERATVEIAKIADKCMHRLHKKGTRMLYAGKPRNKIKTACAREMLGFIWEAMLKTA